MPQSVRLNPPRLEELCHRVYLDYLYDELDMINHLKTYEQKSVLLRHYGLTTEHMVEMLQMNMQTTLQGIVRDIVRQNMADMVIESLPGVVARLDDQAGGAGGGGGGECCDKLLPSSDGSRVGVKPLFSSAFRVPLRGGSAAVPFSESPIVQLLNVILHEDTQVLDFSRNKAWPDSDRLQQVSRTLWKVIGDRCPRLQKLIMPKDLCYNSTLNSVIRNGAHLTHLTLKRNVPTNMFLNAVGTCCPNICELDIAGADVVTDFGVVCLLFQDPEQIFSECWNREKTVGSARRSQKAFPHPYFDKPIPDPQENQNSLGGTGDGGGGSSSQLTNRYGIVGGASRSGGGGGSGGQQFLYLKRTFYEGIIDRSFPWEALPICQSLQKLRLENTKVKADGASVVLEVCPNIYSLGYLVFAAAGLKQVFGYENARETKFLEIFYRGPSDQKLWTIANCCPKLKTMFLGSNNVRKLNVSVFDKWKSLQYLTLENIVVDDVHTCLQKMGHQLRGLKIQCCGFDMTDVVEYCPNLGSLIIQKEVPISQVNTSRTSLAIGERVLTALRHVEISCASFPKSCFNFIMAEAANLKTMKVLQVPGLRKDDVESWGQGALQQLEQLIIFRGPELNREAVELMLDQMPKLRVLGDLTSFDVRRSPSDIKRIHARIREEQWDLKIMDSSTSGPNVGSGSGGAGGGGGSAAASEEKEFSKCLSLHWFYLTESRGEGGWNKVT